MPCWPLSPITPPQSVLSRSSTSIFLFFPYIDFIIFAYEPIYAIGTGTLPRIDKIKEVISFTSKYLQDKYNKKPTIVYGGSVDSSNIKEILNIDNVDGVLIGNRSSNVKEVERMINNIE